MVAPSPARDDRPPRPGTPPSLHRAGAAIAYSPTVMTRSTSAAFDAAAAAVTAMRTRAEIAVRASPGPTRLAPCALVLNATVTVRDVQVADARLVILHDPAGQETWHGQWRMVLFASAELEASMIDDPVVTQMGWQWLEEALGERDLAVTAFGGTVTRTAAQSFGTLDENPPTGDLEIRASWTPVVNAPHPDLRSATPAAIIREHVAAWLDLLELITGLEPAVEGIARLDTRR